MEKPTFTERSIGGVRKMSNEAFKLYFKYRITTVRHFMEYPEAVQKEWFEYLIEQSRFTQWGKQWGYHDLENARQFAERVPIQNYETLKPYFELMMAGERDVLWPGYVNMFSKSSGTTSDKSKYIPMSKENLQDAHLKGGWDTMTFLYHNRPEASVMEGRNLILPGSISRLPAFPQATIGDVSALMINNLPRIVRPFYSPDFDTALMPSWEEKIDRTIEQAINEDIRSFGGVPTWLLVLFRKVLEKTGKSNLLEIWPRLQSYFHGGVGFEPYFDQFKSLIPSDNFAYQEVYNASEGYFATQYDLTKKDLLLLLDNGIYYEFLPMDQWEAEDPQAIPLSEIKLGGVYALIISTNSGLWRYNIGDTIRITGLNPITIKITGRTKQFINAFGEEVMVDNAEKALAIACKETGAIVAEYTVAPVYLSGNNRGRHQWLIEFQTPPTDLDQFRNLLDEALQSVNSDYEAKRHKNMALDALELIVLDAGTFVKWMKDRGKFGGQNKVPRLSNDRRYVEELLAER